MDDNEDASYPYGGKMHRECRIIHSSETTEVSAYRQDGIEMIEVRTYNGRIALDVERTKTLITMLEKAVVHWQTKPG